MDNKRKSTGVIIGFIVMLLLGFLLWQDTIQVRATEAPSVTDNPTETIPAATTKVSRRAWIAKGTELQSRRETRTASAHTTTSAEDILPSIQSTTPQSSTPVATPPVSLMTADMIPVPPTAASATPIPEGETDGTPVITSTASTAALSEVSLMNGDFESGPNVGWVAKSRLNIQIIYNKTGLPSDVQPHSGEWVAWLGGLHNEQTSIQQEVTINSQAPLLSYWYWIESEDLCDYDYASVLINDIVASSFTLCTQMNTTGWSRNRVDLSPYAGQTVQIKFQVDTDSAEFSSLFIDDIDFESQTAYLYLPALFLQQNNNMLVQIDLFRVR